MILKVQKKWSYKIDFSLVPPDIWCNLWKQTFGPNPSLKNCCSWLRLYIMVDHIRRKVRSKKRKEKKRKEMNQAIDWNPSAGGQHEELRPWQRAWGRKLGIRKGVIKVQETPCSRASTPKTRVLYGELSPITISLREGVNLQLQLIKIPGRDKSISTYELWRFSGLPDQARPAACDCLQPPNCERHGMF